ncbi:uncharacterized protein LOC113358968 [Papaver somniferum]|uniref:uncharacterized protein LOC113358968 n=1 Tax=Papaver somniferum TaxID=3469 RepID=UPI000E70538F|nr:uncharacterized protein LOC113358968 [Papaver somniferum]
MGVKIISCGESLSKKKHGGYSETWLPNEVSTTHGYGLWKGIMQSRQLIQDNSRITVNDGKKTSFWKDRWCNTLPLKEKYPLQWRLSRAKEATVNQAVTWAHSNSAWNLHFSRDLRLSEIQEAINLVDDIGNPELITSQEDSRNWLPSDSEPPKVSFFIWSTLWNAAPTLDNLSRRGMRVRSLQCVLCRVNDETIHHVLLHCAFSYKVWSYFLEYCKVGFAMNETTEGCIKSWKKKFPNAIHNFIWNNLPYAIWWALWIERNRRTFHNKDSEPTDVIIAVKSLLFQWGLPSQAFKGLYFDDLVHNWAAKIYM